MIFKDNGIFILFGRNLSSLLWTHVRGLPDEDVAELTQLGVSAQEGCQLLPVVDLAVVSVQQTPLGKLLLTVATLEIGRRWGFTLILCF